MADNCDVVANQVPIFDQTNVERGYQEKEFPSRIENGWVYFILAKKVRLIKIGWAISPPRRLKEIEALSPVPVKLITAYRCGIQHERAAHYRFRHSRSHNEWFKRSPELNEFIRTALSLNGPSPWTKWPTTAIGFSMSALIREGYNPKDYEPLPSPPS